MGLPSGARLHVREAVRPDGPAVVVCPGGGLRQVNLDKEGRLLAPWLDERGVSLAVLEYRMPSAQPLLPQEDVREAVARMRGAEGFGRVGVMGMSVGGYYAAAAATLLAAPHRPDFQVLLYPLVSMDDALTLVPLRDRIVAPGCPREAAARYSPERHVDGETPRAFIAACDDDPAVSPLNSTAYFAALHAAHVRAELHVYPYGGHGFATSEDFPFRGELFGALGRFLGEE